MSFESAEVCAADDGALLPWSASLGVLAAVIIGLVLLARVNRELAKVIGWTLIGLLVAGTALTVVVPSCP